MYVSCGLRTLIPSLFPVGLWMGFELLFLVAGELEIDRAMLLRMVQI